MSDKALFMVLLTALAVGVGGSQVEPKKKELPQSYFEYIIEVGSVSLRDCKLCNAYVVEISPGKVQPVKSWFRCGPLTAKAMKFRQGNSFLGPEKRKMGDSRPAALEDMEYQGELMYRVLADGFPMKLNAEFKFTDLVRARTEFEMKGEVVFNKENDLVIMRSAQGDHILLLRLIRK